MLPSKRGIKRKNDSFFFLSHLDEDDKYPVFLDGNHSLVRIENKAADGGKLLLLKDSFGHSIAPFLSEHYSEIIMVDLRYYKLPVSELIEKKALRKCSCSTGSITFATTRTSLG